MNNELKLYPYQEEMMHKLQPAYSLSFMQLNGRKHGKSTTNLANFLSEILNEKALEQTEIAKLIKKRYGIELNKFDRQKILYRDSFEQAMIDRMRSTIEESNPFIVSCEKKYYDLEGEMLNQTLFYKSEAYRRWMDYNSNYSLLAEKKPPIVTDSKA